MPWKMSLLVVASVALAAGETSNGASAVDPWLRFGQFGCLAVFCAYGMMKFVPDMQKRSDERLDKVQALFAEENQKNREHSSQINDKLVDRMEKDRTAEREVLQEIIKHCAQESAHGRTQGD